MLFPKSVNIQKFKEYLTRLRQENGDDKICLFMDNLTTHTSDKSKKTMRELGIRYIWNIAYSPDYNAVESVFSKVKQKFRVLRVQKLMGQINDSYETIIEKAFKSVRKQDVINCVNYSLSLLK